MWLTLLACAAPSDPPGFTPGVDDAASVPATEPVYDAAAFETIVADALDNDVPNLAPLARAVIGLFDAGNAECPGPDRADYSISVFDPAGCTTEDGYWYEGAGAFVMGLRDDDFDGRAESFDGELKMDMSGRDPAGNALQVGGDSTIVAALGDAGPNTIEGVFAGTYRWSADPAWLGQGVSAALWYGVAYAAGGATVTLDGGFTVVDTPAIGFDAVVVGGDCGPAPTGAVLVRDLVGHWYRLDFDPTTCDGCGALTFNLDTDLGRACVDLETPTTAMAASLQDWTVERVLALAEGAP